MASPSLDGTIIRRIREYAAAMGWAKSRLAAEASMPANTLRKFHDADWNPTADTLRKLEALIPDSFRSTVRNATTAPAARQSRIVDTPKGRAA